MAEKGTQNPTTGTETDISKAQSAQQPPAQARQDTGEERGEFETREQAGAELTGDQAATGQAETGAAPDEGLQGETTTRQRTDIEGGTLAANETGQVESGFFGAEGEQDTSAELIEEEDEDADFRGDGE